MVYIQQVDNSQTTTEIERVNAVSEERKKKTRGGHLLFQPKEERKLVLSVDDESVVARLVRAACQLFYPTFHSKMVGGG